MAFNLSKNNDPVPVVVPEKKNKLWIVLLLVVVIVGVAVGFFIPKKETGVADTAVIVPDTATSTPVMDTAALVAAPGPVADSPVATDPAPTAAGAPPVTAHTSAEGAPTASGVPPPVAAPARVAASFNKGNSAPIAISDEVVKEIKKAHKITIYGYASSEGDISVNKRLAQERAVAFKQYLISKGVDASMITAIGKGIDNPIATNDTETGRTQNRRVEVSIE